MTVKSLYNSGRRFTVVFSPQFSGTKNSPPLLSDSASSETHMSNSSLVGTAGQNLLAPTASTSSVFGVLAITAKDWRSTAVIGIGGAFLHAGITEDVPVFMKQTSLWPQYVTVISHSLHGQPNCCLSLLCILCPALSYLVHRILLYCTILYCSNDSSNTIRLAYNDLYYIHHLDWLQCITVGREEEQIILHSSEQ